MNIAFFSRGRGRAHAVPDVSLARHVQKENPEIRFAWISYGTGADTLRRLGCDVVDLRLPERNGFLETQVKVTKVLAQLKPDAVISHEEFPVPVAARAFDIPNLFITDYFLKPRHIWMRSLQYADKILFIDEKGHFDEPVFLRSKVDYTGPFIRPLEYSRKDRHRARLELGYSEAVFVILVLPGGWQTEFRAPLFDIVHTAFRHLPGADKRLVWMAGGDICHLQQKAAEFHDIEIRPGDPEIGRWMCASDVAITKGTRKTALELESLGVPAISISFGLNRIDDDRIAGMSTVTHLKAAETTPEVLSDHILRLFSYSVNSPLPRQQPAHGFVTGAAKLAEWLLALSPNHASDTVGYCGLRSR